MMAAIRTAHFGTSCPPSPPAPPASSRFVARDTTVSLCLEYDTGLTCVLTILYTYICICVCACDGYTARIGFLVTSVVSNEQDIIIVRRWVITTRRSSSLVVARWSITKRLDIPCNFCFWFISSIFQPFSQVS